MEACSTRMGITPNVLNNQGIEGNTILKSTPAWLSIMRPYWIMTDEIYEGLIMRDEYIRSS
jgi:hypothetical protein